MGKDRKQGRLETRPVQILNCDASEIVSAKENDVDRSGDNSFYCRVNSRYVPLKPSSKSGCAMCGVGFGNCFYNND